MKTITIRGITADMDREIKKSAKQNHLSINEWLLRLLKQSVGLEKEPFFKEHTDLDHLAAQWSDEEANDFLQRIDSFEQIDRNLWK